MMIMRIFNVIQRDFDGAMSKFGVNIFFKHMLLTQNFLRMPIMQLVFLEPLKIASQKKSHHTFSQHSAIKTPNYNFWNLVCV